MKKPTKSQLQEMTRILVPGLVVFNHVNIFDNHIRVEVVSEEDWIQNSNQRYGEGLCCYVKNTTTTIPSEHLYNLGEITIEELEANVPIVKVDYRKWYLPHTNKGLYDHLIALSEKNTTFVPSN
jgi:hypothetical protein